MRKITRTSVRGFAAAFALAASSCGGGGGGGSANPPAGLTYSDPAPVYETSTAVPPDTPSSVGGPVALYAVAPALPAGLTFDAATGVVAGTPTGTSAAADYVVTATNPDGADQTTLRVTVVLSAMDDLSPKTSFTDDDVRFFLGRTHFGATPALVAAVNAAGLPAYVDQMLAFQANPTLEANASAYLLNVLDDPALPGGFPSPDQVARYWLYLMLNNPNPFQEALAFFWHDHFASSTAVLDGSELYWAKNQIALWRTQGNGNLRQLLIDMSRDWVMLEFLNGVDSVDGAPNENFAREFWELFTAGVDNGYTQADIVQSARAFTGYRVRFNDVTGQSFVEFSASRHDGGAKTILGVTIPAQDAQDDYVAVVDITLQRLAVAEHVSKKIFEHFGYEAPSALVTDALAQMLRGGNWELTPLLETLFKSRAFFSARAKAGLVKGPLEHFVGFIRSTGLTPIDNKGAADPPAFPQNTLATVEDRLSRLAQVPTQPPSVNGWPVTEQWLSAQNLLDRANAVMQCINDRTDQASAGIDVTNLLPPPGQRSSPEVVDALALLLHVALTTADRQSCIDYLDTDRLSNGTVIQSPFDATNATHVSQRVRGLLYILSLHPTYALR